MMTTFDAGPILAILTSFCCCFFVVIGLGYLAYRLLTAKQTVSSSRLSERRLPPSSISPVSARVAQYGNIVSSITDDGFYLFNNFLTPGTMIHYRFRGSAGWVTRCVPYQPGPQGHYVYVGNAPADVQVVDVVPYDPRTASNDEPDGTIISNSPIFGQQSDTPLPPSMIRTTGNDYPSAY